MLVVRLAYCIDLPNYKLVLHKKLVYVKIARKRYRCTANKKRLQKVRNCTGPALDLLIVHTRDSYPIGDNSSHLCQCNFRNSYSNYLFLYFFVFFLNMCIFYHISIIQSNARAMHSVSGRNIVNCVTRTSAVAIQSALTKTPCYELLY